MLPNSIVVPFGEGGDLCFCQVITARSSFALESAAATHTLATFNKNPEVTKICKLREEEQQESLDDDE
jgi:hypothetical protein